MLLLSIEIDRRMKAIVVLVVLLALCGTVLAEDITVGNQVVSIGSGNSSVTTKSVVPFQISGLNASEMQYATEGCEGRVIICSPLMPESQSIPLSDCKRLFEIIMKQEFINVEITPYGDGFIGTGESLDRNKAYGILKPVDIVFGMASKLLIVTAVSPDKEISKKVVSSAEIAG
jgi:hypothetical protein